MDIRDSILNSDDTDATISQINPQDNIDPNINKNLMMTLLYAEHKRKGYAGHHIESMNSFNKIGIKQIVTKVFTVDSRFRNLRDKTEEDKSIAEIAFHIDFTDVDLTPPSFIGYQTGNTQVLMPNMARIKNLTYSSQFYITAKITATAYHKNGSISERQEELSHYRIAPIPCAIKTEICNLHNLPRDSLKKLEEDPNDPGGYFIIKGSEWAVDCLENTTNNMFHVYKNKHKKEVARGNFVSKPGDAFENSYAFVIRLLTSGAITIEITTGKLEKIEIPFYILFRAMGMTRDRDIINNIVYGVDNNDMISRALTELLEHAYSAPTKKFDKIKDSRDPAAIIQFIARQISEQDKTKPINTAAIYKDENILQYLNNSVLNIFDRILLPHVGQTPNLRIRKLRFLGHLINKLLCVHLEIVEQSDRDSYKNKRIYAAGTSIAKAFKTHFNCTIVQAIKRRLTKDFKSSPFSQVQLTESVKSAIHGSALEKMLTRAITTASKPMTGKQMDVRPGARRTMKMEITNRVSAQVVHRKNELNVISILNTINTSKSTSSKQSERADEMRRVHPSFPGFIDVTQSADSGEKVGMVRQLCISASVTEALNSSLLRQTLLSDPDIIPIDNVEPEMISEQKLSKVFVNGDWIGCCHASYALAKKYRIARRNKEIHYMTTIIWEPLVREIYFWVDVGRLLRPLIIVYNNIDEYIEAKGKIQFRQWIKLRAEHLQKLQTNQITMEDLHHEQIIEYISPGEQENAYIAYNIDVLREMQNDLRHMFTHCDIDQAIFGMITLAAPFASHSYCARNTFYTNHRKQSAGWYTLSWPFRTDKLVTIQHYCERPMITTFTDRLAYPNGLNTIVALQLYGGQNIEDSITVNQNSVDCGMFNASFYSYEKAELKKDDEQFNNPDFTNTMDIKKDANYEYIDNDGFINEGTIMHKNYVMIVKTEKIAKPIDKYLYVDKSILYKRDEPAFVERVIMARDSEDTVFAKVKYRMNRPLAVGDKLSCLTPDHDVLTPQGWVPIYSITSEDYVLEYYDGKSRFANPKNVFVGINKPEDPLYIIDSNFVCMVATGNHRMYVSNDKKNWEYREIKDIKNNVYYYGQFKVNDKYYLSVLSLAAELHRIFGVEFDEYHGKYICLRIPRQILKLIHIITDCFDIYYDAEILFESGKNKIYLIKISNQNFIRLIREKYRWKYENTNSELIDDNILETQDKLFTNIIMRYFSSAICKVPNFKKICVEFSSNENLSPIVSIFENFEINMYQMAVLVQNALFYSGFNTAINTIVDTDEIKLSIKVSYNKLYLVKPENIFNVNYDGPVYCLEMPSSNFYVRFNGRISVTGNSFSGNKGIVSNKIPRCDLPYTESGLVPDLIVNAHSIPTRMAISQLIECAYAQLGAARGAHIEGTTFVQANVEVLLEQLKKHGIEYGGHHRMSNGMSGDWIDTLIFIGPTSYQRPQRYVSDEIYAQRNGPTNILTHQPVAGRANNGGSKLGEMEKDVFEAAGVSRALAHKFNHDSDGIELPICRMCHHRAFINPKFNIYKCKYCGDEADVAMVASTWVANLFFNEASAMNIDIKTELEPYKFPIYESADKQSDK